MGCEIDAHLLHDLGVSDEVVERRTTLVGLQPVDNRKTAVVADDDDELVTRQHGAVEVAVHHHVGAVTNEDHDIAIRQCHLRSPAPGDLITHARIAVFGVKRMHGVAAPAVHELTGEPTGGRQRIGAFVCCAVDNAYYLRVSGKRLRFSGGRGHLRRCQLVDVGVVLGGFGGAGRRP